MMFKIRRVGWLAAGVGSLVLLSGCSAPDKQASVASASAGQVAQASLELGGVHNMLITDEGILLGTHRGVWLQTNSQDPVRVGDSRFDVMGLAKFGSGLVASGHPGETDEQVGNIGLRGSTDQGRTWENISLSGQVDFHRLTTSGQTIMGLSSADGALLVSTDGGETWIALPNPNIYDLALDPNDSLTIVGTTETGPILSSDGGKTFSPIPGAPLLVLLSWDTARLVGVGPDGLIYESLDKSITWNKVGSITGEVRALTSNGGEIAVLAGTNLYYSIDAGRNFNIRITGIAGH